MRKLLFYCLTMVVLMLLIPDKLTEVHASKIESEVLVKYRSEASKQLIMEQAEEVVKEYEQMPLLAVRMPEEKLQALKNEGHIAFYERDKTLTIQHQFKVANIASTELQRWNLKAVNAQQGWHAGFTGKGVKIAVIDSGVANHPDLTIAGGISFIGSSYNDDHGHGTHVAGIIAAKHNGIGVAGVAPNAEVYAVKAIGADGQGHVTDVLKAIDWAIENKMDILNLSFGDLGYAQSLHEGIKKAAGHGMLIVAASGNEGNDSGTGNTINYPARHEEVISVTSVNKYFTRSSFSGTGDTNDFAAPGEEIYSTYLNGQYAAYGGTSMAAPHIAGLLALLKEQYPYASAKDLRDGLRYIAEDLGSAGFDAHYGYGLPKFQNPNDQVVSEWLSSGLSAEAFNKTISAKPDTIEKLALINEWNKMQQTVIVQIDQLLKDYAKQPLEQRRKQLEELLANVASADLKLLKQQELDHIDETLMKPAKEAVNAFNRNKTIFNYRKADTELKKLPSIKGKEELEQALAEGLQLFAKQAMDALAQYEKQPTKKHFDYAHFTINRLPDSSSKTELSDKLKKQVQDAAKHAAKTVASYEKAQTFKNYNTALRSVRAVYEVKERAVLEKRLQKTVANNLSKAKIRTANYEKKKTRANRELAMKLVRELPNGKDKAQLLKRLKWLSAPDNATPDSLTTGADHVSVRNTTANGDTKATDNVATKVAFAWAAPENVTVDSTGSLALTGNATIDELTVTTPAELDQNISGTVDTPNRQRVAVAAEKDKIGCALK